MVQGNVLGRKLVEGGSFLPTHFANTITTTSGSGRNLSVDFTPKFASISYGDNALARWGYNAYTYDGTNWRNTSGDIVSSDVIRYEDGVVHFYTPSQSGYTLVCSLEVIG